ncbi:MAG: tetratricopeptide repeat protein [Gemmatimonadales bacterium]
MAQSREIEKLQRRWQENPLGLTFAPLAEAYRKEGMYADALELLDIGLAQHPNYVPAHIVRGRCHLDAGSDSQAEAAFTRVTDLDPENVIALKGLAEIAERAGRYHEAADLLGQLLAFDRSNDDAKAQLARVRSALATPSPGRIDPGPVVLESQGTDPGVPDTLAPTLEIPAPSDAPLESSEPAEPPSVTIEPLATMESELAAEADEAAVEGVGSLLEPVEPVADEPSGIDLDAPIRFGASGEAEVADEPAADDEPAPVIDLSIDLAGVGSGDADGEASGGAALDVEAGEPLAADVASGLPEDVWAEEPLEADIVSGSPEDVETEEPLEADIVSGLPEDVEAEEPLAADIVSGSPEDVEVEVYRPIELSAQPAPEYEVSREAEAPVGSEAARVEAEAALAAEEYAALSSEPAEPIGEDALVPKPAEAAPGSELAGVAAEEEGAANQPEPQLVAGLVEGAAESEPEPDPLAVDANGGEGRDAGEPAGESGWEAPYVPAEPTIATIEAPESPAEEARMPDAALDEPEAMEEADAESEETTGDDEPLLVTETMAELFLKQGHQELALAVYSQLATRDPENSRIRDAIARLSGDPEKPGVPSYAAARTGGRSVRNYFDELLGAAPPDSSSAESGPALGSVFGDEPSTATATQPPAAEAGPSFDEFFGDDHPSRSGAPGEPRQSAAPTPTSSDDIEEFNSWLRGLKR